MVLQDGIETPSKPAPDTVEQYTPYTRTSYGNYQNSPVLEWVEKEEVLSLKMSDLEYTHGAVTFQIYVKDVNLKLVATIDNSAIIPEFRYVERYFKKIIGKSSISVNIRLRIKQDQFGKVQEAQFLSAWSPDIEKINPSVITEAQKDYSVDYLFSANEKAPLESVDDLLGEAIKEPEMRSAEALVKAITEKRSDCKHTLQLKYLAGQHLAEIQPLKFGRERAARTFLFVVQGRNSLYLVLEPINDTLATYLWACPDSPSEVAEKTKEVENLVCSFEEKRRRDYRKGEHIGFFRIEHRYKVEEDDFLIWQQEFQDIINQ